ETKKTNATAKKNPRKSKCLAFIEPPSPANEGGHGSPLQSPACRSDSRFSKQAPRDLPRGPRLGPTPAPHPFRGTARVYLQGRPRKRPPGLPAALSRLSAFDFRASG